MLQKIMDNDQCLTLLQPRDRESLAAKLLQIGKSLLKAGSREAERSPQKIRDSVKWLQRAFSIIEPLENVANTTEGELKRSILRSLARAYYLSSSEVPENLARAEATLQELLASVDAADQTTAEFQQLRWMRVAVLKRRKATSSALLDAFRSIVDHMPVTEGNITDILQELRTLGQDQVLVTTVHQHCLQRVLSTKDESSVSSVERLLLSLIFHCSKDETHTRAMHDIQMGFELVDKAEFDLSKVAVTACLTLIWQFGDRQYNAKRWSEAADWFLVGTHSVFNVLSSTANPKCFRKGALCYIQLRDYARASATARRCSGKEAATHYILLLIAVHQGLEDEAISAVQDMVNAADFNPKMLLLATQLANEYEMKPLLLSVLEALLRTLRSNETPQTNVEAVTLVRCIIRLVLKLMAEPAASRTGLIATLIRHYQTAIDLVANLIAQQSAAMVTKDISWLWRTAYNTAVQGCSEWEDSEESVSTLFDTARQLLEYHRESSLTDVDDAEVHNQIINASFAAVAGRVFAIRRKFAAESADHPQALRELLEEISVCKKRIRKVGDSTTSLSDDDVLRTQSLLHVLRVFEAEMLCHLKDWNRLLSVIEELVRSDALAVNTFEAIADILWVEKDCPVEVLFTALEAILHASLDRTCLSIGKFSRWLRAICTILLSRNTAADRAKAIGYAEQAVTVLEEHTAEAGPEETYPVDERVWLLGTSYNTGIECLHASLLDEAKRWFEAATTVCRFVPDGGTRAAKISDTYTHLLARYTTSHGEGTLRS
ncbi:hypothetical protein CERSUDRAFT_128264 [Gelatoporia subvermispora B]|uniref:Protein ZIP4 homolog n=1 Tax=Ceriporiopsis subvermispora (strain B) TaxID=914234 RepID=M2RRG9_CERS8|nr:hypothetical protein CERSUDRAFT_128264 [Gelatoporia subvermispora B]